MKVLPHERLLCSGSRTKGGSVWLYARCLLTGGLELAVRGPAWELPVGGITIHVLRLAARPLRGYMRTA